MRYVVLLSMVLVVSGCTSLGVHTGETRVVGTQLEESQKYCEYAYDNGTTLGGGVVWDKANEHGDCPQEAWVWN